MTYTPASHPEPISPACESGRPLRVLIVSNMFPPAVMGGAELAAHSLATWLARAGHTVRVLTSAPRPGEAGDETDAGGFTVERRFFPNIYPIYQADETRPSRKLLWHARDHFNPDSEKIARDVIGRFRPDIVNTHDLQGIGYNLLREIGRQKLPCVQTLHDLGFLCINMSMFKDGEECRRRHLPCAASALVKRAYFSSIRTLAFWSPSQALLERYRPHLPRHTEAACIQLPLLFPPPPNAVPARAASAPVRLLYVGQLTEPKGIEFLLRTLDPLACGEGGFELLVVGSGTLLEPLKARYAGAAWVKFTGRIPPEQVAGFMTRGDLLMIPSLWFENSPLVAYQANQLGLPILASRIGGIPELVREGGILLPPGDAARWQLCVREMVAKPEKLEALRAAARQAAPRCDPDLLGDAVLRLLRRTLDAAAPPRAAHRERAAV